MRLTMRGSGRFSRNFYKPLIGMIQTIRRWKDIDEAHLFHVEHSVILYGLRAVSNLLNRGILFFKFFKIFGTVFTLVF